MPHAAQTARKKKPRPAPRPDDRVPDPLGALLDDLIRVAEESDSFVLPWLLQMRDARPDGGGEVRGDT